MKKFVCIVISIVFLLLLVACGEKEPLPINDVVKNVLSNSGIENSKITTLCEFDNYIASLYYKTSAVVTNEELQVYVDTLLLSHEEMIEITDRNVVEKGDAIVISYVVYRDSEMVANAENESLIVGLNNYGKDFENFIIGAKVGTPFSFELNAPIDTEKYKTGDILKYNATVKSINYFKSYTVSDQYILDYYDATTEEEFLSLCKENLKKEKNYQNVITDDDNFLDKVAEKCEFVIDEQEVAEYSKKIVEQHSNLAYISGLELSEYIEKTLNMTEDGFYDYCYNEGVKEIKRYLLVGATMKDFDIENNATLFFEFCSMMGYDGNQTENIRIKYEFLKTHTVIKFSHSKATKPLIRTTYDQGKNYTVEVCDASNVFGKNHINAKKYVVSDNEKSDLTWVVEHTEFGVSSYSSRAFNHLYDTKVIFKCDNEEIVLMVDNVNNFVKYERDGKIVCVKLSDYFKGIIQQIKQQ